jgi:hypothetical protein
MGKSDAFIFPEYRKILEGTEQDSAAFLGFCQENDFTRSIMSSTRHFYDAGLKNWEINSKWNLRQKYDLIVCTRCAYFSKNPKDFIERCLSHLSRGGTALIDWGLGDHWRFSNYKVGWVRDGEHEYAYGENNKLYSCFWKDELLEDDEVKLFWDNVRSTYCKYKNEKLKNVIRQEVPSLVEYKTEKIRTKFLWPDKPQLYIITMIKNEKEPCHSDNSNT